jgi:hypothetical protein
MGPICRTETSVRNYRYLLRNNPEQRSSHLFRGGSVTSRNFKMQYSIRARDQITLSLKKTYQNLANGSRNKTQLQIVASGVKNKPDDRKMNSVN